MRVEWLDFEKRSEDNSKKCCFNHNRAYFCFMSWFADIEIVICTWWWRWKISVYFVLTCFQLNRDNTIYYDGKMFHNVWFNHNLIIFVCWLFDKNLSKQLPMDTNNDIDLTKFTSIMILKVSHSQKYRSIWLKSCVPKTMNQDNDTGILGIELCPNNAGIKQTENRQVFLYMPLKFMQYCQAKTALNDLLGVVLKLSL